MKKMWRFWRANLGVLGLSLAVLVLISALMLYRLGSLTGGLSETEVKAATEPLGLAHLANNVLYLPLKLVRYFVFGLTEGSHGQLLTRLPNAIFGGLSILSFGWLIWLWHGPRTAILTTLMFATAAWTLHVSRLASFDVLYLWGAVTLLLSHVIMHRFGEQARAWYACLFIWGLLLTIPGMIWFVLAELILQRHNLLEGWRDLGKWWQRVLSLVTPLLFVPAIGYSLIKHQELIRPWLGLPAHFADGYFALIKQFGSVFVHLFIRGPQYPELWLGRMPILSVFTLIMVLLGIYVYAVHWQKARSRLLLIMITIGVVLVGLGGPVGLSVLVPVLYVISAAGIAYLLHEWLKVFPRNPLARSMGVVLVSIAVIISCTYNLRAYFIAWPAVETTDTSFRYHR